MRSLPTAGAEVAWVLVEDLGSPGRVVRTLVAHPELEAGTWLLPVDADPTRLSGLVIAEADREPDRWKAVRPRLAWVAGASPVATTPGRLGFWSAAEIEHDRLARLAKVVAAALGRSRRPLLASVAAVEHVDGLVGGHAISRAALLVLAERHPDAPELGDPAMLRRRFHAAAPNGLESLTVDLNRTGMASRLPASCLDALAGAAVRASRPNGVLRPDAWATCRDRTLWAWWIQTQAAERGRPVRGLAAELDLPVEACVRLARGEATPGELDVQGRLPDADTARGDLDRALHSRPSQRAHVLADNRPHRARLSLYARQLGELERAFGDDRLSRWADARRCIEEVRRFLALRQFPHPWEAAEAAAELLRAYVEADPTEPLREVVDVLDGLGIHTAGAALPFEGLQGAFASEEDGAPVLVLTPAALGRGVGARRFALLHQLGHLVAGHADPCTKWVDDQPDDHGAEAFANAFAAYFAAPRASVRQLVKSPKRGAGDVWFQRAAREVAATFGLGPESALPHLLNCLDDSRNPLLGRSRVDEGWRAWREGIATQIGSTWREEGQHIVAACGGIRSTSVERALERPRSPTYDRFLARAVLREQVDPSLTQRYAVPPEVDG